MSKSDHILLFRRDEESEKSSESARPSPLSTPEKHGDDSPDEQGGRDRCLSLSAHVSAEPFNWKELQDGEASIPVEIRLGSARLAAGAPSTAPGDIVVLDARVDDSVEIVVSGKVIGRGRLVVAHEKMAVEICQIDNERRRKIA